MANSKLSRPRPDSIAYSISVPFKSLSKLIESRNRAVYALEVLRLLESHLEASTGLFQDMQDVFGYPVRVGKANLAYFRSQYESYLAMVEVEILTHDDYSETSPN